MKHVFSIFTFGHFAKFSRICKFIFEKLPPILQLNVSIYYILDHFLVHSSAKDCLRGSKNVLFTFLCILVQRPKRGLYSLLPPGYVTVCSWLVPCCWLVVLLTSKLSSQQFLLKTFFTIYLSIKNGVYNRYLALAHHCSYLYCSAANPA